MHLLSLVKHFWNRGRAAVFHFLVMICLFNYRKNSLDLIVEERIKPYDFFFNMKLWRRQRSMNLWCWQCNKGLSSRLEFDNDYADTTYQPPVFISYYTAEVAFKKLKGINLRTWSSYLFKGSVPIDNASSIFTFTFSQISGAFTGLNVPLCLYSRYLISRRTGVSAGSWH